MSEQWPGGFITKTPPTPQGPYQTDSAYGIWNLSQQAEYQKQGLWPTAGNTQPDTKFNYVSLLLHCDGTNGAQNTTFLDESTNSFTVTRSGNVTQGSFSPYGSNWANYFVAGSSNYLSFSGSAINFGTGDFTIEWWVYREFAYTTDRNELPMSGNGGTSFMLGMQNGFLNFGVNSTSWNVVATTAVALSTWTHLAVVRSGSTVTIYVNGVASGSTSMSTNFTGTSAFEIGRRNSGTVGNGINAFCSNLRVVSGTAVYTGNFTPSTTPLTAVSGTSLLTCQSNRFIDNSSNAFTASANGTLSVTRLNPFGTSTAYSTSTIGGSFYSDGSASNYLSLANNANLNLGSGDFTIECWIYRTTASGTDIIWSQWNNGGDNATQFMTNGSSFIFRIGATSYTFGSFIANTWNHVAVSRSGSTVRMFVNGVLASTQTDSSNITTTGPTVIGCNDLASGGANYFNGWISGFRQVKGTAVYTAAFTPPTAPPTAVSNTQLLLNMTNAAVYDNAMMGDVETDGNIQINTSIKKYGTGSIYNAATVTGSGLKCYLGAAGTIGNDYTLEWWAYHTNLNTGINHVMIGPWGSQYLVRVDNGTNLQIYIASALRLQVAIASSGIVATTWQHYAITRSGSTCYFFVDGVQKGTWTQSGTVDLSTISIAAENAGVSLAVDQLNGYMDDIRLTNGYCRYTTTFTPPTAAFPNTGPI